MGILNYSTTVEAIKSAGEAQTALAKHGASMVSMIYLDGQPSAIAFTITTDFGPRDFQLPANSAGVEKVLDREWLAGTVPNRYRGAAQANRVAWRILKDWITAQLAIIEAGMTTLDEVMLPYMLTKSGRTLSQEYRSSAGMRAAIEAPHREESQ